MPRTITTPDGRTIEIPDDVQPTAVVMGPSPKEIAAIIEDEDFQEAIKILGTGINADEVQQNGAAKILEYLKLGLTKPFIKMLCGNCRCFKSSYRDSSKIFI